jgi:hypothetical protein
METGEATFHERQESGARVPRLVCQAQSEAFAVSGFPCSLTFINRVPLSIVSLDFTEELRKLGILFPRKLSETSSVTAASEGILVSWKARLYFKAYSYSWSFQLFILGAAFVL